MATHISPSKKQSQSDSLRQAFQNLSVNNYLKRQRSDFNIASTATTSLSSSSSPSSATKITTTVMAGTLSLSNNKNNHHRCNYLTVHSPPPPLALKPSQSSPTATSPGLSKSHKSSPLASPRTPTSQVVEQPYSPYYDSGFNVSSSSIASSCYSSSAGSLEHQGSNISTTASNSSVVEEDEEEDEELSMPSTPPPPTSPCAWIKQDEESKDQAFFLFHLNISD